MKKYRNTKSVYIRYDQPAVQPARDYYKIKNIYRQMRLQKFSPGGGEGQGVYYTYVYKMLD